MVPVKGGASSTEPNSAGAFVQGTETWEPFFGRVFPRLARLAGMWADNKSDGEDAAAYAMSRAWQRWSLIGEPEAYVYRVALRYVIAQQRKRTVEKAGLPDAEPGYADDAFTAYELAQWLRQLMARLTPPQRSVMEAAVEGLVPHEIASLLGCSRDVVYQRLHAARRRLQQHTDGIDVPRPRKETR